MQYARCLVLGTAVVGLVRARPTSRTLSATDSGARQMPALLRHEKLSAPAGAHNCKEGEAYDPAIAVNEAHPEQNAKVNALSKRGIHGVRCVGY